MAMQDSWVDKIFQKLTLVYGRDFLGRWEGIPLEEVKADWAHELDGYENAPHAIHYALTNLPPKAPTVLEFRSMCQKAPPKPRPALHAPSSTYTPEVAKKALAEARALLMRAKA
jgi:hypothetical protein